MSNTLAMDSRQIEMLFRDHYEGLGRYAFSILKSQVAAEEAVQKLFVNLWEKRDNLKITEVKAYLYRSVYNSCMNELKKKEREKKYVPISDTLQVMSTDHAHGEVMLQDLNLQINEAIACLPEKCAEVFRLSRHGELSYLEISEKLDISVKTVENHMGKALRIMRAELQAYMTDLLLIVLLLKEW